ncbi:TRAP transporter large permease [Wukongibacter baidiensis]|uniref:TRAP transporter large permease n=1 Tax=Wukongibacter baidiensis TaxID=1723361 RepID=UPI003D7F4CA7
MVMGVPIAFNLIISTCSYMLASGYDLIVVGQKMYEGMNSFSFLAVPFFVLTGQLMLRGGLLEDLIDFVNAYFGRFKGAIAMVTIGAALLMGSIVGLAVASAASLGVFLIPMMKKAGYSPAFAAATMSSASLLGPVMPPSVLMIIYCISVGNTSIAGLFLAAVVPALLTATAQIIIANRVAAKRNYPSYGKTTLSEKVKATKRAVPALFLPVIILGGIFSGVFSITEASSVAVLYSGALAFFVKKSVKIKDIPELFMETTGTTGLVLILAGAGSAMAWAIANEQILNSLIGPLSSMPSWLFLLLVNVLLIITGCFMDDYASVVILAPIIAPIGWALGVDPLQMGAIICINLVIGLATPPFGITLFVTSPIAGVSVEETVREAIPYLIVTVAMLLITTFVPAVTTTLPRLMGY